jgi:hypothetical protein
MTYNEFKAKAAFGYEVKANHTQVVVRVFVKLREGGKQIVNVGATMDRQFNEMKMWDASVQGTLQELNWDSLIRAAKRMLFYHILGALKIEDIPDLRDEDIETVLSELN